MPHHMVICASWYRIYHAYDTLHLFNRSYFLYLFFITCHTIWSRIASTSYIPRSYVYEPYIYITIYNKIKLDAYSYIIGVHVLFCSQLQLFTLSFELILHDPHSMQQILSEKHLLNIIIYSDNRNTYYHMAQIFIV